MTEREAHVWATVYAAVTAALSGNSGLRASWDEIRARANVEANMAVRKFREAAP